MARSRPRSLAHVHRSVTRRPRIRRIRAPALSPAAALLVAALLPAPGGSAMARSAEPPGERIPLSGVGARHEAPEAVAAIPYFARRYGTDCSTCHVTPPKLNEVGEEFLARGYRMPDRISEGLPARSTPPLALWMSSRGDWLPGPERNVPHVNRVELISGGPIFGSAWSYFMEWRAVSFEAQSDGTLRDRSGRFEDLFVQRDLVPGLLMMIGQYRMLTQVDVSRRIELSEPFAFSTSVPGDPADDPRITSLRGFSQSGRAPALRLQWQAASDPVRSADGWHWVGTVPFAGELSIPLTSEARDNASLELESRPKGLFVETFYRRGLSSVGVHAFAGDGRWLAGTVGAWRSGPWFTSLAVSLAHRDASRGRWSWQGEWIPSSWVAFGFRVEDRSGDATDPSFVPYAGAHWPGTRYTVRLVAEHRMVPGRPPRTALELSTVF